MMAAEKLQQPVKYLSDLLDQAELGPAVANTPVTGIKLDSRRIQPGDVFVALQGEIQHGLEFLDKALVQGAVAVIYDVADSEDYTEQLSRASNRLVCVPVKNLSHKLGEIANRFYDAPSKHMFVVGVTGTDGKTSSTHFIQQLLGDSNNPCGVIGTLGYGAEQLMPAEGTTPDVFSLHAMFADMKTVGIQQVAMEVSSHGIAQERIQDVDFDIAVLTNVGRDHLDYHQTLEQYRAVKKSFLADPAHQVLVLNLDDELGMELAEETRSSRKIYAYSLTDRELSGVNLIRAADIRQTSDGLTVTIEYYQHRAELQLPLFGLFNVANVLLGVSVLLAHGINFDDTIGRLRKIHYVPGRMQRLEATGEVSVIIDYAHTPQALAHSLGSLRHHFKGKLICVFGCGGNRDQGKRPLMAANAEQFSDFVIVTSDNPRNEDPELILREIESGFTNELSHITVADRKLAIHQALELAKPGDVVLIAGKGHENYQIVGDKKLPFDDSQVVREFLGSRQ